MILSQKEISFQTISQLREMGKSDSEILLIGPQILLERFSKGEWEKTKGSTDPQEILRYGRDLLKNWMKKDTRLNGGEKYSPKTSRPRTGTTTTTEPDYKGMRTYFLSTGKSPDDPIIIDLEMKIMEQEIKKVG